MSLGATIPATHRPLLDEPRIATCTLLLADGRLHSTPVKAALLPDESRVVVLVQAASIKARALRAALDAGRPARASLAEHTASLWLSLEGPATLDATPAALAEARQAYAQRHRQPSTWGDTVLTVHIEHVLTGR